MKGSTKKPFLPLSMVSGMPPTVVVTTGKPVAERLQHGEGMMLVEGGEREDVSGLVELGQFLVWVVACEDYVVFYAEFFCVSDEFVHFVALSLA